MKTVLLKSYAFNLKYAHELVANVPDELMTKMGGKGLENHAAFTLGHLVSGSALTAKYLGAPYKMSDEWEDLFRRKGPGDPRKPALESSRYPAKKVLLDALDEQHDIVSELIRDLNPDRFEEATTWRFSEYMPTLGDLLYFMCVTHESMHLGQLAGWRRSLGFPSALATL